MTTKKKPSSLQTSKSKTFGSLVNLGNQNPIFLFPLVFRMAASLSVMDGPGSFEMIKKRPSRALMLLYMIIFSAPVCLTISVIIYFIYR